MMNARVKKIWIEALESGKYEQGQGTLREEDSFCCLGVLCDLYHDEVDDEDWCYVEDDQWNPEGYFTFLDNSDVLPQAVMDWAGMDSANPIVNVGIDNADTLADVNDNGMAFQDIAQIIRKEF